MFKCALLGLRRASTRSKPGTKGIKISFLTEKKPSWYRAEFPLRKVWLTQQYKKLFEESEFIALCQTNSAKLAVDSFKTSVVGKSLRTLEVHNRLMHVSLTGTPFASILPLFTGPTTVIYCPKKVDSNLLKNLKELLSVPTPSNFMWMGAWFQNSAINSDDMNKLSKLESIESLGGELLALLKAPSASLVRTLKFPTDNLVKVASSVKLSSGDSASAP